MKKEEWYSRRNNRINNVEGVQLNLNESNSVCVMVNSDLAKTLHGQVMLIFTVNMLSRWCSSFFVYLPEDALCIVPNHHCLSIKDNIDELVKKNDPYDEFIFVNKIPEETDIVLCIGVPEIKLNYSYYWIEANNWIAGYGYGSIPQPPKNHKDSVNLIGAGFAACLGMSALFQEIITYRKPKVYTKYYSLYDFCSDNSPANLKNPIISDKLNIGNIVQVGCGAVGSSFDYILSLLNVTGTIHLIDFDKIEIENICSSLLFDANSAIEEMKKVNFCKVHLENIEGLNPIPHDTDYDGFINEYNYTKEYPDLLLCFANERNIWTTIQCNLPPTVLHATTTPNWGLNFGRHIPFKEWCIVCRFGTENLTYTPVCSEAKVFSKPNGKEVLGVLPFLSPASAILTLAEIIKMKNYSTYPVNNNFVQFIMKVGAEFSSFQVDRKPECPICSSQDIEDYTEEMRRLFGKKNLPK